jgi:2-phosphosulfolactate phosphatase
MRIDVAFTPGEPADSAVAIVIDVLRATTTITQALASGYVRVLACGELDQARALAKRVNGGAVLAGERQCVRPEGFDLGNSPREFTGDPLGETLILTTTNGTRAIVTAAEHAERVVIGSLLNLISCSAQVARMAREAQGDVLVQCAGVRGDFTMDDAYTAGRFVHELGVWLPEHELTDAARAAEALAGTFESAGDGLAASRSARNLRNANLYDDVRWCAREGVVDVVPSVVDVDDGVAMITA